MTHVRKTWRQPFVKRVSHHSIMDKSALLLCVAFAVLNNNLVAACCWCRRLTANFPIEEDDLNSTVSRRLQYVNKDPEKLLKDTVRQKGNMPEHIVHLYCTHSQSRSLLILKTQAIIWACTLQHVPRPEPNVRASHYQHAILTAQEICAWTVHYTTAFCLLLGNVEQCR